MRLWLAVAALNGFVSVAAGAIGAHALRGTLDAQRMGWFELAGRFQMWHALALLGLAILMQLAHQSWQMRAAAWLFAAGLVLFCGGLYLMALAGIASLGPVVPSGGLCFLAGWIALAWAATRLGPRD